MRVQEKEDAHSNHCLQEGRRVPQLEQGILVCHLNPSNLAPNHSLTYGLWWYWLGWNCWVPRVLNSQANRRTQQWKICLEKCLRVSHELDRFKMETKNEPAARRCEQLEGSDSHPNFGWAFGKTHKLSCWYRPPNSRIGRIIHKEQRVRNNVSNWSSCCPSWQERLQDQSNDRRSCYWIWAFRAEKAFLLQKI